MADEPAKEQVVAALEGDMTPEQHTAFIMRVFMHLAATMPGGKLKVDLRHVAESTKGKRMYIKMDGPAFEAHVVQEFIKGPGAPKGRVN